MSRSVGIAKFHPVGLVGNSGEAKHPLVKVRQATNVTGAENSPGDLQTRCCHLEAR